MCQIRSNVYNFFLLNVLMTLYSGRRAGVISVLVTTVFYIIILFIYYFSWIDLQIFNEAPFEVFLIVFINFNTIFELQSSTGVSPSKQLQRT